MATPIKSTKKPVVAKRQANPARRSSRSSGDYTGRQKDAAIRASRAEQQERSAEITMQDAEEEREQQDGVFDPKTGDLISGSGPANVREALVVSDDDEDEDEDFEEDEDDEEDEDEGPRSFGFVADEPVFTGHETEEEMAPHVSNRRERRRERRPSQVQKMLCKVRIDQDIEDMTYGMVNGEPNNFTFREGFVYEVPTPVAEHLEERGLIRQWL